MTTISPTADWNFQYHLTLHALAIRKAADASQVAVLAGMPVEEVQKALDAAQARGRVANAGEKYVLTAPAQVALRVEYSRYYGELRRDPSITKAYERFETVNTQLKQLITDWQTIPLGGSLVKNDHSDRDYDARIVDRLGNLHDRFLPLLGQLQQRAPRLAIYGELLEAALERVEAGEIKWISDAALPSYHTVWFDMHEDLLRLLGRTRDE